LHDSEGFVLSGELVTFFTRMQCKQENYKKIISKHRERCPINDDDDDDGGGGGGGDDDDDDDDDDNFISALACFAHQLIPVIFVSAVALDFQLQTAA